jgi:hypothetical protein
MTDIDVPVHVTDVAAAPPAWAAKHWPDSDNSVTYTREAALQPQVLDDSNRSTDGQVTLQQVFKLVVGEDGQMRVEQMPTLIVLGNDVYAVTLGGAEALIEALMELLEAAGHPLDPNDLVKA